MTISANSGGRWRLADSQRAGGGSLPDHGSAATSKAIASRQTPSPTSATKFLIANLELEFRVTRSKQRTEAKSNRKKTRVLHTPWRTAILPPVFSWLASRHPLALRPCNVPSPISNRNSRFTGFHSTCSKRATKRNSNRNKNGISAGSATLARHAFLPASPPCCLAAARLTRYNSGSHIEVNQP